MKKNIIYVDFISKRRITFVHFILNKIILLLFVKFNIKNKSSTDIDISKNKRISN